MRYETHSRFTKRILGYTISPRSLCERTNVIYALMIRLTDALPRQKCITTTSNPADLEPDPEYITIETGGMMLRLTG